MHVTKLLAITSTPTRKADEGTRFVAKNDAAKGFELGKVSEDKTCSRRAPPLPGRCGHMDHSTTSLATGDCTDGAFT